jgi:hypothetical protein
MAAYRDVLESQLADAEDGCDWAEQLRSEIQSPPPAGQLYDWFADEVIEHVRSRRCGTEIAEEKRRGKRRPAAAPMTRDDIAAAVERAEKRARA